MPTEKPIGISKFSKYQTNAYNGHNINIEKEIKTLLTDIQIESNKSLIVSSEMIIRILRDKEQPYYIKEIEEYISKCKSKGITDILSQIIKIKASNSRNPMTSDHFGITAIILREMPNRPFIELDRPSNHHKRQWKLK